MQIFKQIRIIEAVQYSLLSGKSVKQSIDEFIEKNPDPDFLILKSLDPQQGTPLIHLLKAGVEGHRVGESLLNLKLDLIEKLKLEIDLHLKWLPLISMIPVLLFMFPAFLMVLIGPVVARFLDVLG